MGPLLRCLWATKSCVNKIKQMNSSNELQSKVVIVGDSSVGKTSIISRFVKGEYTEKTVSTFGCISFEAILKNSSGNPVKLHIWDTAGQEKFRSLSAAFFRGANFAIIVFDLSKPESFHAIDYWIDSYVNVVGESAKYVLVGNKVDLITDEAQKMRLIKDMKKKYNCNVILVSAKDGTNIEQPFKVSSDSVLSSNNIQSVSLNEDRSNQNCC